MGNKPIILSTSTASPLANASNASIEDRNPGTTDSDSHRLDPLNCSQVVFVLPAQESQ